MTTKLYRVWSCMKYRCHGGGEKNPYARWYRDRGIEVCEEWRKSFKDFEEWALANGYKEGLTIDRIDPDGNYCPENCRWVTRSENSKRARPACSVTVDKSDYIQTPLRGSHTITEEHLKTLERICIMIRDADPETKEKMLLFCEGAVFMNNVLSKKEV